MESMIGHPKIIATGEVSHIAPCVPECPICHPESAPAENFAMFGLDHD